MQTFLGRKRAGPKRSDENANVQDRLATLNWMLDVNHAMKPIGWSFTSFAPMVRAESVQKLERPPILILCTDQEATQLAAVAYLKNKKKAFVEHVSDPAHRSHNDASLALSAVGLLKFSTWSLNLYNLRFGPWQKSGAWSSKIQETAEQMSKSMSPSDPLLLEFFPDILADDGRGPDENTEEERRRFLAELPQKTCIRTKGIRASSSRFNSLTTAHAALDREWSILALVMTVVCVQSGWCKSAYSLYAPGRFSGASAVRASGSKAAAKAAAKSELNAERQGHANTLHLMTKFICSSDNKMLARTVFQVLQPEEVRCSLMLRDVRGADRTVEFYSSWAHWSWMKTAKEHLAVWRDLESLARVGFQMDVASASARSVQELEFEDGQAGLVVGLTHNILRYRAGSQLFYTNGFGATAGLLHPDTSRRDNSRSYLREVHRVSAAVQDSGSRQAKRMLADHSSQAPVMQWILSKLAEQDFMTVADDLVQTLKEIWSGLLNSKLVEDCNKIQREAEQRNKTSKDLGRLEGWSGVSEQRLVENYGRSEVKGDQLFHVPAEFNIRHLFTRTGNRFLTSEDGSRRVPEETAEEEFLKGVTKQRDWPSHNHNEEQNVLADFSVVQKAVREGDYGICERAWFSGLLPEKHAILVGQPVRALYVLRTYKNAALCWPGRIENLSAEPQRRLFLFDEKVESLYWMIQMDKDVRILDLEAVSPSSS